MNSSAETRTCKTFSPAWSAVVGAGLHGALWYVTAHWWINGWIGGFLATVERYGFIVPDVTERILPVWEFIAKSPIPAFGCLMAVVCLDGLVLYFLDRRRRMMREIWSAMMLAVPLGFVLYSGVVIALPYQFMYEGLVDVHIAKDEAVAKELAKLQGSWRVVRIQSGGEDTSPQSAIGDLLEFEDDRFSWSRPEGQVGGTVYLRLRRLPKAIEFSPRNGPHAGSFQPALYKFDEDQLVLRLAPINSFGDDLPTDFDTSAPQCTTLVLQQDEGASES